MKQFCLLDGGRECPVGSHDPKCSYSNGVKLKGMAPKLYDGITLNFKMMFLILVFILSLIRFSTEAWSWKIKTLSEYDSSRIGIYKKIIQKAMAWLNFFLLDHHFTATKNIKYQLNIKIRKLVFPLVKLGLRCSMCVNFVSWTAR